MPGKEEKKKTSDIDTVRLGAEALGGLCDRSPGRSVSAKVPLGVELFMENSGSTTSGSGKDKRHAVVRNVGDASKPASTKGKKERVHTSQVSPNRGEATHGPSGLRRGSNSVVSAGRPASSTSTKRSSRIADRVDGRLPESKHSAGPSINTPEPSRKSTSSRGTNANAAGNADNVFNYLVSELSSGEHQEMNNANNKPASISSKVSKHSSSRHSNVNASAFLNPNSSFGELYDMEVANNEPASLSGSKASKHSSRHSNTNTNASAFLKPNNSFGELYDMEVANNKPASLSGSKVSKLSSKFSSNHSNAKVDAAAPPGSTASRLSRVSRRDSRASSAVSGSKISAVSGSKNSVSGAVDAWINSTTGPGPTQPVDNPVALPKSSSSRSVSSALTVKGPSSKPQSNRLEDRKGNKRLRTYTEVTESSKNVTTLRLRDGKPHVSETKTSNIKSSPGAATLQKKGTKASSDQGHYKQVVNETTEKISLDWDLRRRQMTKTRSLESKKVTRRSYKPMKDGEKKDDRS